MVTALVILLTLHAGWTGAHWEVLLFGGTVVALGRRVEAFALLASRNGLTQTARAVLAPPSPLQHPFSLAFALTITAAGWSGALALPYALGWAARSMLV